MKAIVFFIGLVLLALSSYSQYHIAYHTKYYDHETGEERAAVEGKERVRQAFYIMDGYYKNILDGEDLLMVLFDNEKDINTIIKPGGETETKKARSFTKRAFSQEQHILSNIYYLNTKTKYVSPHHTRLRQLPSPPPT